MKKIILFLIAVILLTISCRQTYDNSDKMIFRYNESSGINTLDPAFSSGQSVIWPCNLLYNGLVDLDEQMRIVPSIAKSWTISAYGTIYTFTLRDDVYFHQTEFFPQKRKVTANDFVYSLGRIVDGNVASPGAWIFQKVKRDGEGKPAFEALNDSTFQITLSEDFPPFLGILAMKYCSVVPHEMVEKYGKDFRTHPVGTGPFKFQIWEEGVKLVLRKNPDYFETDEEGKRLPYLDAVAITFIVDKQSVFMEFMKGSLDFMSGIDACYKDALLTKTGELNPDYADRVKLLTGPYLNTEYLGFMLKDDGKDNPLLKKEVRQAINYGFDREKMMRYLRNNTGYPGTSGFVPMGLSSFDNTKVKVPFTIYFDDYYFIFTSANKSLRALTTLRSRSFTSGDEAKWAICRTTVSWNSGRLFSASKSMIHCSNVRRSWGGRSEAILIMWLMPVCMMRGILSFDIVRYSSPK